MENKIEEYSIAQLADYYGTDKENDIIGKTIKVGGKVKVIRECVRTRLSTCTNTIKSFLISDKEGRHIIANAEFNESTSDGYIGHVLQTNDGDEVVVSMEYRGFMAGHITDFNNKTLKSVLKGEV
ncbi:MAG: hypothetical protein HZB68_03065 [Candidatus Aenigmarchaeota archaeon]|nr:hypothetical protein [Candidatus Aenigmarchaeota archaeon]